MSVKSRLAELERRVQALRWASEDRTPGLVVIVPHGEDAQACIDRQVAQRRYPPTVVITLPDNGRGDRIP